MTIKSAEKSYRAWKQMCDQMERLFKEGRYANKKEKTGEKNKKGR